MLDHKSFLQGINYLKASYINWQFDLNNDLQLSIWFKKFSQFETDEFKRLIEKYTDENKYPPNSPHDILALIKSKNINGEEAWKWIMSLNKQYPLDNEFYKPKFYQELKTDLLAYELFNKLCVEEILLSSNKDEYLHSIGHIRIYMNPLNYAQDKFISWYNHKSQPKQALMIGTTNLLLK